jgi:hypothetical protein
MVTFAELAALFPPCETYKLDPGSTKNILGSFTDTRITSEGHPLIRSADGVSEHSVAHWLLPECKLIVGAPPASGWERKHLAQGEAALLVTDRALRGTFIGGASEQLGRFAGGWSARRSFVLAFTWPLDEIDCVSTPEERGKVREVSVGNTTHDAWLHVAEANIAKDSFIAKGIGLRNKLRELSEDLIRAAAQRQRAVDDRAARADAVLRGERARNGPYVEAWFGERPAAR